MNDCIVVSKFWPWQEALYPVLRAFIGVFKSYFSAALSQLAVKRLAAHFLAIFFLNLRPHKQEDFFFALFP